MNSSKHLLLIFLACAVQAQVRQVPYYENFDSVIAPALPAGWTTTSNRSSSGDFTTTTSTVKSSPNAVVSTNSKVSQSLISPLLDFTNKQADSLIFYERRSSSHNSGLLIEASLDSGKTFPILIGDTLKNPGVTSYVARRLKLPALLDNQPAVKMRWRVVGNGTGATGTIRFDNDSIKAIANLDAGVSSISFSPSFPVVGDSVFMNAVVKNFGLDSIQNISVEFYQDANGDSIPQVNERLASRNILQPLAPNDTTVVSLLVRNLALGQNVFIVKTVYASDQNSENDLLHQVLFVGLRRSSIVVNEIMYAPTGDEPEWVELYNRSLDTVDLKDWKLSDQNTTTKYIITSRSETLLSKSYVVITKDTALFKSVHPSIPSLLIEAPLLPTFNNSGDAVVLFDNRSAIMDSVHYLPSWGGKDSISLERIEPDSSSLDSTNWGSSVDYFKSTPGKQNSLTPVDYDLSVLRVSAMNSSPTSSTISVFVRNVGRFPASNFSVSVFVDTDYDYIIQPSERLDSTFIISTLLPKDSITVTFTWNNATSGEQPIYVKLDYPQDLRPYDNNYYGFVGISYPTHSLVINEIMYNPAQGQNEWIELYNPGQSPVYARNWMLHDQGGESTYTIITLIPPSNWIVPPRGFLIIAVDSVSLINLYPYLIQPDSLTQIGYLSRPTLSIFNNEGDDVVLWDQTYHTIDSIHYFPNWHNPNIANTRGHSLERINPNLPSNDPRNWSTCTNPLGGTPGKQNSIYTTSVTSSMTLSFSPNPFSPDGDGHEDFTIISYELPTTAASVRIRIFDAKGRLIRTLANGEPSGSHGQIIWDGFTDSREKARMGIYIVLLDALDANGGTVQTTKGVAVVAAKL